MTKRKIAFDPEWFSGPSTLSNSSLERFRMWLSRNMPAMPREERRKAEPLSEAVLAEIRRRTRAREETDA